MVLRSGVEVVLIGSSCYASPQWVGDLFGAERASTRAVGAAGAVRAAGAVGAVGSLEAAAAGPVAGTQLETQIEAGRTLRILGSRDPYSMCCMPQASRTLIWHVGRRRRAARTYAPIDHGP